MRPARKKNRIDLGHYVRIVDVREPHEYAIARLPNTKLIPLGQVASRVSEFDPSHETVVMCKGGVRSLKAIRALRGAGYKGPLVNLTGGITAWSDDVDSSVPRY